MGGKQEGKSPHGGHRERLRAQILEGGLDALPAHTVLEFLLFYAIPRRDTNELAHRLIAHFGSLSGVLDARYEELLRVPGLGKGGAAFLSSLPGVFRRYQQDRVHKGITMRCRQDVCDYLATMFVGRSVETVFLVCMDLKNRIIASRVVAEGSVAHVTLPVRQITELALSVGAVSIVIGHNHPNGVAVPSENDIRATQLLMDILAPLHIELVDHVIVADEDYVSLRDSGCFAR